MIKLAGIRYRFHPLFVLVMSLSAFTGFFFELLTLFAIVFIHEMGHVAAAKGFGWNVKEVQLLPFGGVAVTDDLGNIPAYQDIVVALAGPLQNALMIGLSFALQATGVWPEEWGRYFIQANLVIALFNLLPISPLDGGKVLQALLTLKFPYHRAIIIGSWFSLTASVLLLIFAAAESRSGIRLNLLILGIFLFYSNWYAYRNVPFHFLRFLMHREERTSKMMDKGTYAFPIIVPEHRKITDVVKLLMRERYHLIYVMGESGTIQAVVPEQRLLVSYFNHLPPGSELSDIFM